MLGVPPCLRMLSGVVPFSVSDQTNASTACSASNSCNLITHRLILRTRRPPGSKSVSIYCHSSRDSFEERSGEAHGRDEDYLESFVLVSETKRHYHMRNQEWEDGTEWQRSSLLPRFPTRAKGSRAAGDSIGVGFLRRFKSPTIFLKIFCDGDLLLPIIVGESAVERLIASRDDELGDCPSQFQFVRNLTGKLGYEVTMVRITERVVNTYFAKIYIGKLGEKDIFSIDARPSDAINIATTCKAPIYVNKHIVATDAIRIAYGFGRARNNKVIFDVSLDSAPEGLDLVAEELGLVRSMYSAIEEERYGDAAMWKDKLMKLRRSLDEPLK